MSDFKKHPPQRIHIAEDGCERFVENKLVRRLLDFSSTKGLSLNELSVLMPSDEHPDDWTQLAQLTGYSVSGFGDLSYVSDDAYERALSFYDPLEIPQEQIDNITAQYQAGNGEIPPEKINDFTTAMIGIFNKANGEK